MCNMSACLLSPVGVVCLPLFLCLFSLPSPTPPSPPPLPPTLYQEQAIQVLLSGRYWNISTLLTIMQMTSWPRNRSGAIWTGWLCKTMSTLLSVGLNPLDSNSIPHKQSSWCSLEDYTLCRPKSLWQVVTLLKPHPSNTFESLSPRTCLSLHTRTTLVQRP